MDVCLGTQFGIYAPLPLTSQGGASGRSSAYFNIVRLCFVVFFRLRVYDCDVDWWAGDVFWGLLAGAQRISARAGRRLDGAFAGRS